MEEFYKGSIINVKKLKTYNYILDLIGSNTDNYQDFALALHKLSKGKHHDKKEEVDRMVIDLFHPNITKEIGQPIIYIKMVDAQGNAYGEELVTGLVFPIKDDYSTFDIAYSKINLKHLYLDKDSGRVYSFGESKLNNNYCLVNGRLVKEQSLSFEDLNKLFRMNMNNEKEVIIQGRKTKLTCVIPSSYGINVKPQILFEKSDNIHYAITNGTIADKQDVHYYLENFEKGFGKRKRKKEYCALLEKMFLRNRLNDYIFPLDEIDEGKTLVKKR